MGPLAINHSDRYTYKDYLTWPDNERWELIHGRPYNMTPAPTRRHQGLLVELLRQLANYFHDRPCKVYGSPFDVRLPAGNEADDDIQNVVQPDISVICDPDKLDEAGCKGGPDLVIEIASPSTSRKDLKEKFLLYEEAGVKEYWIVQPEGNTVMIFKQGADGRYGRPEVFSEEDTVEVLRFEGLSIDLKAVFAE